MNDVPEVFKRIWSQNEDGTVWTAKHNGGTITSVKLVNGKWFCQDAKDTPFVDPVSAMVFASKLVLEKMERLWPKDGKKS